MKSNRALGCVLGALFLAAELAGQTVNGTINGTVTDATGSVIPGFAVEVINQTTGLKRSATGSEIGTFTVPLLPPGLYTVSISKDGFTGQTRKEVQLLVNQNLTLDTTLTPSWSRRSKSRATRRLWRLPQAPWAK